MINYSNRIIAGISPNTFIQYEVKISSGILDNLPVDFSDMIPDRTVFLTNFTQRFKSEPFGVDVLRNDKNWKIFVPNENSGPCYTYTPPADSDPGDTNSMYMVFNFTDWDPLLEIFIHDKNDFFYSKREMLNTKIITSKMLNETNTKYPRALGRIQIYYFFFNILIYPRYMIVLKYS